LVGRSVGRGTRGFGKSTFSQYHLNQVSKLKRFLPAICPSVDDANPVVMTTNRSVHDAGTYRGDRMMKTMILALAAVLGIAAGTAALSPEAHASKTYLFEAAQNGNG
jgi:hypothetical protein